ncbi:MAG TPA: DUF3426 domain-containing protein [Stellaceae bacterium]|nr:DUF3426 domain-containing protein [Stellaceae bacterium]
MLLALVALVAVVLLDRDDIIAKWPQAAPIYAKLHLAEAPPGSGLDVSVTPTRTADALLINGDIVNRTGQSRRIPRLRITLRDGNSADVASKIIDPPVESLAAGATAHFSTTFDHPSSNATGTVAVTFAE